MILSDVSIREALADGRIVIDPLDERCIQPSSVDLHVDRYFRVFRNDTTPYIDPKEPQENLTELVDIPDEQAFILHPGEFVLGSTLERVALPGDLVARLEGKSSLGRLGLLIHSSLPASEPVLIRRGGILELVPIGEIVAKQVEAEVVSFDPETFAVEYHPITGWYEGPADRIYEIRLASGRTVRVTAGHNLFTLDREGRLAKTRTLQLSAGTRVAVPGRIPTPVPERASVTIDVLDLVPESEYSAVCVEGPGVSAGWTTAGAGVDALLKARGLRHVDYYRGRGRLPLDVARQVPEVIAALGRGDRLVVRGGRHGIPLVVEVDREFAWMVGMYVAEGSRRRNQMTISNADQRILDRLEAVLGRWEVPLYRSQGAITVCSAVASLIFGWMGTGEGAPTKRVPRGFLGLPVPLMEAFFEGLVDGDGSRDGTRTSVWTSSPGLVADVLLIAARLGRRAGSCLPARTGHGLFQVYLPEREHKLLTSVPLPDRLLVSVREASGLNQATASRRAGYRNASDLNNIEMRCGRDAVRVSTLRRLRDAYSDAPASEERQRLERLVDGDLMWDTVVSVTETESIEPIYDIEVRPGGRKIENFLAGSGGVFVSNTAGFVDAGWDGHLTLELSNVANLPIAIYPGMKIGQISFLQMTSAAEHPYGSAEKGSKYQGQRGPTPSRYYLNFREDGTG